MGVTYNSRYADGQKRCQVCELYINWDIGSHCPCCGSKLRTRPRNKRLKKKYRQRKLDKKENISINIIHGQQNQMSELINNINFFKS